MPATAAPGGHRHHDCATASADANVVADAIANLAAAFVIAPALAAADVTVIAIATADANV